MRNKRFLSYAATLIVALSGGLLQGQNEDGCKGLPDYSRLKAALTQATAEESSGLNLHMWGTIVDRDGVVCAVAFSGVNRGAQWPGSRVIAAQKANTANAFSLDKTSGTDGSGKQADWRFRQPICIPRCNRAGACSVCRKRTWLRRPSLTRDR